MVYLHERFCIFPGGKKETLANARDAGDTSLTPCREVFFFPWSRNGSPPIFLPRKLRAEELPEGYRPWNHKGSTTERLTPKSAWKFYFVT